MGGQFRAFSAGARNRALADLRQAEVRNRTGEPVEADAVSREWVGILRQVRAGVLAVMSHIRARLPHLTAHDVAVLDDELRAALAALADDRAPR